MKKGRARPVRDENLYDSAAQAESTTPPDLRTTALHTQTDLKKKTKTVRSKDLRCRIISYFSQAKIIKRSFAH